MKKYISLISLLLGILLNSCSKKIEDEIISKKIERIIISPEYLLQLKSNDIYIGIRYFKDYTDKDEVSLTLNNANGVVTSETVETLEGTNLLFRVPGISQVGDYKVKCTVKNDQNSLENVLTLRVVNDFSINTVWNSLDKNYSSSFTSYADRLKGTSAYALRNLSNSDTQVQFGAYVSNLSNSNQYVEKSFIPSLHGSYTLTYNTLGLQQIRILNGEPNQDPNFSVARFYAELTATYGNYISQTNNANEKITVYKNANYLLTITETPALVSTIITRI